jgi:hypothetical protein
MYTAQQGIAITPSCYLAYVGQVTHKGKVKGLV